MKRSIVGAAICAATIVGFSGSAFAGEITGNGKTTPIKDRGVARSACAFSGLEDGIHLAGFDPDTGLPIFVEVDGGPGVVQTPHGEPAADVVFPPGVAGQSCRGNAPSDL